MIDQDARMTRLPSVPRDALDDTGQQLWDSIASTRGAAVVNDAGGLMGPFNAWVTAPSLVRSTSPSVSASSRPTG